MADFLLPINKDEEEPQVSSCNQVSRAGWSYLSYSEDSDDENKIPPLISSPMDDEGWEPDDEEYLLDEILNENDFITDPFFYQEVIPEIKLGFMTQEPKNLVNGRWIPIHSLFHQKSILTHYL